MVNAAFALEFTTPCKLACKCGIYPLCLSFPPSFHFFAPYLHRVICVNPIFRAVSNRHLSCVPREAAYKSFHYMIQLFRERLSEKVHATIPKGIVGGFEFTVLQRNLKECTRGHGHMFASAKGKQQKKVRQLQCQEQRIAHIPYYLSRLSRAHFFRQPFSK